jgi:ribosomal protein L17
MQVRYTNNLFKLKRTPKERRHLIRSLATHLAVHEKIRTTAKKAKYMKPTIDALIDKVRKAQEAN